jgi:hypothetical protein
MERMDRTQLVELNDAELDLVAAGAQQNALIEVDVTDINVNVNALTDGAVINNNQ